MSNRPSAPASAASPAHPEGRPAPPELLGGRYSPDLRLGVGGMGEVWRALDQVTGQSVAIKVLKPSLVGTTAAQLRFQREIRALARLRHPRIVPVIDAGHDPQVGLYFVMTLQEGRPLNEVAQEWRHWRQLWPVLSQILDTLTVAHAQGVIHRDIKPENLLVDREGQVVLLDFGVARLNDQVRSGTSAFDILGTVDYAAPEQATGERRRIGPWTDLYSLGLCLWALLCNMLPFQAASPVQSLMMRMNSSCPPLRPRPQFATPVGLQALLARATHPDPFQRFRSAAEFKQALEPLAEGPFEVLNLALPPPPPPASTPSASMASYPVKDLRAQALQRLSQSPSQRPLLEPPLPQPPFVSRTALRTALSRGLNQWALSPKAGTLVLHGAEGVGKTRLLNHLLTPMIGEAQIEAHRHAWLPKHQLEQIALSITGAVGLEPQAQRAQIDWFLRGNQINHPKARAQLAAWMRGELQPDPTQRSQFFAHVIYSCTRRLPFVLWIDDLPHLEGEALLAVEAVRTHKLPAIVLLSPQKLERPDQQPLPSWLTHATRTLDRLSDEALHQLLQSIVALPSNVMAHFVRYAEGNPKRLLKALRSEQRKGHILPAWPRWIVRPQH